MLPDVAIQVENVHKRYYLSSINKPRTVKSALLSRFKYWSNREAYWALQGVNLTIKRGQTVGLIGNNGAGKSTLLRMISSLSLPTKGRVYRQGRLGSLLELGAGFNNEFTGRENIITGSITQGFTRKEALARLDRVVDFAELHDFIDNPIRTYSSGMFVRLAFATEINLDPDILLVDEVLAVGDLAFQKKCFNHILSMKEQGKTIVLVSHVMGQIQALCDEVVWLEHGKVRAQGQAKEIINRYKDRVFEKLPELVGATATPRQIGPETLKDSPPDNIGLLAPTGLAETVLTASAPTGPNRSHRKGTHEIEITTATLFDEHGQAVQAIQSGDPLILHVNYRAYTPVDQPVFMVGIFSEADDTKCYEIGNQDDSSLFGRVEGESSFNLAFSSLNLMRGSYYLSIGAYQQNWEQVYDYRFKILTLVVEGHTPGTGVMYAPHRWQL